MEAPRVSKRAEKRLREKGEKGDANETVPSCEEGDLVATKTREGGSQEDRCPSWA